MSQLPAIEPVIARWLDEAAEVLRALDLTAVARAAAILSDVRARGGVIYTAGNGGSASTASHLAVDLQKAARSADGTPTRAVCLSDSVGLITAWANDEAFDRVFAEQLEVLARPGDAVVIVSVSGSSPNVIALLEAARTMGVVSVGLLGRTGGRARSLVDTAVVVPSDDYGWVESTHVVLHHVLAYVLRERAASPLSATRTVSVG